MLLFAPFSLFSLSTCLSLSPLSSPHRWDNQHPNSSLYHSHAHFSSLLHRMCPPKTYRIVLPVLSFTYTWHSLVAQMVKRLSKMRETWVRSLGWEDLLEKEIAIHSNTIAWKIPWTEEPGRLQSLGSQRVGDDWVIHFTSLHWYI